MKGKVDLLSIKSLEDLKQNPELISSLVDVIDFEEMPPEGEPPIESEKRKQLLTELESILEKTVSENQVFHSTPIRRMNRFQYNNSVEDLFDLKCVVFALPEKMLREHKDYFKPETGKMEHLVHVGSRPLGKSQLIEKRLGGVAPFPQDLRAEHGYDTQADHLSLSPLLMEEFLKLSRSVVNSKDFTARNVGIWNDFFVAPKETSENETRLRRFLTRAFRHPVDEPTLQRYISYLNRELDEGNEYTEVMKAIASAVIASPRFLYLYDGGSEESKSARINDFELASRLSFFLWGSIPDQELLELAERGELGKEDILSEQLQRMLRDRKLKRFCDSFPSQWLQLERIISSIPNPQKFKDFYFSKYRDSMHMMVEPLLIFETVLIENLPITQLIDSDFTYRSDLLIKAYGLAPPAKRVDNNGNPTKRRGGDVTMLSFFREPVTDRRYGGVITNAATMTMTSGPERTQPITRGAWIAGVVFNNPPEPPPADVPALGEKPPEGEEHLTLRERLSAHRERSDCKGCHEQIDPLGFALENFDPIGVWREKYENGREIDTSGTLFRKHEFTNVIEFKDAILAEKDRFARGLAGHLLSFSLGRHLGPADQLALDEIAEATAADDYKIQTLIREVVTSDPFLSKTTPLKKNKLAKH